MGGYEDRKEMVILVGFMKTNRLNLQFKQSKRNYIIHGKAYK